MSGSLFQFDIYDEYVFNAVFFLRHIIKSHFPVDDTDNSTELLTWNHRFTSLHGYAETDARHNLMMYFTLWDLDPGSGLFYPVLEQADPPHSSLIVVGSRVIHWPGNGQQPTPDYCAFFDCSTGIRLHYTVVSSHTRVIFTTGNLPVLNLLSASVAKKSAFSPLQEKLCVGSKNDWHLLELSRRSVSACKVWGDRTTRAGCRSENWCFFLYVTLGLPARGDIIQTSIV